MSIYACIDLELERPIGDSQAPDAILSEEKIIQLGYVIGNVITGEVFVKNCIHINIGVPLTLFIRQLTGIKDEDIKAGTDILSAYETFKNDVVKFEASRVVLEWGNGDCSHLLKECLEAGLKREDWYFGRYSSAGFNVKHLYRVYAEVNKLKISGGLGTSMNRVGLQWENATDRKSKDAHNALSDSYNTFRMFSLLLNKMKEKV